MTISKIEWTDRSDWNPIRGCTRVSPGCGGPGKQGGCYAEGMASRFSKPGQWGHGFAEMRNHEPRWTGKVELQEDRVALPLSWRQRARVFVSSTSDVFHEALPDTAIDKLFAVMALCPQHTFQVLTKRPERMLEYWIGAERYRDVHPLDDRVQKIADAAGRLMEDGDNAHDCVLNLDWPLPNIWLGISAEDQERWDERKQFLRDTPAAVRFASFEPLLGAIHEPRPMSDFIQWSIVGGESGPRARPMHPDWARNLRDQSIMAGVPFLFKQWGEWAPTADVGFGDPPRAAEHVFPTGESIHTLGGPLPLGIAMRRIGKKAAGRLLDGREWSQFPPEILS